jgi:uncharacterized C2H2 Zn-finger protein
VSALVDSLCVQQENNELAWKCAKCGKATRTKHNLKDHVLRFHVDSGGLPCPLCGFLSKNRRSLAFHMKKMHDVPQKSYLM